jgi:hypothetical protein
MVDCRVRTICKGMRATRLRVRRDILVDRRGPISSLNDLTPDARCHGVGFYL